VLGAGHANMSVKRDERVLGDPDFVEKVLKAADESFERKYLLKSQGYDIDKLAGRVAEHINFAGAVTIIGIEPVLFSRQPNGFGSIDFSSFSTIFRNFFRNTVFPGIPF